MNDLHRYSPQQLIEISYYAMLLFGKWWLLEARIFFRKGKVLPIHRSRAQPAQRWEISYDAENNFARMEKELATGW